LYLSRACDRVFTSTVRTTYYVCLIVHMYIQTYSSFAPWTIWIFIDPVFLEELQFELSRLTRRTMAQTNYDATSCYDRIIPNLASMVTSQTYGVPKSVTASNAETLLHASYHIRTDLGLAEEGYSHSLEHQFTEQVKAVVTCPLYGASCRVFLTIVTTKRRQRQRTTPPINQSKWFKS
jgi:hypothetical protein